MKKLSGFSLMEMMVVLLIVSVVAAASAPMINKRMVTSTTNQSYWSPIGINGSIGYNLHGSDSLTAAIGTSSVPQEANNAKLLINSGNPSTPQLAIGNKKNLLKFLVEGTSILMTDDISGVDGGMSQLALGFGARINEHSENSIAIGTDTNASASHSIALGGGSSTENGDGAIAIGWNTQTTGAKSIVIGNNTSITRSESIAIGSDITTAGNNSVSIGPQTATSDNTISIGRSASTAGANSIAIGSGANTAGANSIAIGHAANASVANSIVFGDSANATGANTIAIGYDAKGSLEDVVIGKGASSTRKNNSTDTASGSVVIGRGASATATSGSAIAIGNSAWAREPGSIAIGTKANSDLSAKNSIAIGSSAGARGGNAVAIGENARAYGINSVAIGANAHADRYNQIVLGGESETVYIPGNLVVAGNVLLGNSNSSVYVKASARDDYFRFHYMSDGTKIKTDEWHKSVTVGNITFNSDRRLKNVGKVFNSGLDEIRKLEVFNYTFKADKSKTPRVGVMAQDLQKIFPNAVTKGEDGFLKIRMEDMFYALVNAVKENDSRITALEKENIELKKRLSELEKKIK